MLSRHLAELGIRSVFTTSTVVVGTGDPKSIRQRVPECFELDYVDGRPAVAAAFVEAGEHRPGNLARLGRLPNVRLSLLETLAFCSYQSSTGRTLRGFYLLGSATGPWWARMGARIVLPYSPSGLDIEISHDETGTTVSTQEATLAAFTPIARAGPMIAKSQFKSPEQLAPFLEARSFNFRFIKSDVYIMQGVLKNWEPTLMEVSDFDGSTCGLDIDEGLVGFQVRDVPYLLRLGRIERPVMVS